MHDDVPITDEQMRLATARSLPAGAALDSETALLRENFLALGGAIAGAASDFDEAGFAEKLQQTCQPTALVVASAKATTAARWTVLMAGGVLALSALMALVWLARTKEPVAGLVAAPDKSADSMSVAAAPQVESSRTASEPTAAWVDPLDDEIASAQAQMRWLTNASTGLDGSLSQIGQQLEALSQELVGESL